MSRHADPSHLASDELPIRDGSLELLKWIALVSMTADHVNKYLLNASEPLLFNVGRIALPLFVLVFAANLARPGSRERGAYSRTARRLALCAAVASLPYMALGGLVGGWFPLNVLATLLVLSGVLYGLDRGGRRHGVAAALLFVVGGALVEFWWPALGIGVGIWLWCRQRSRLGLAIAVTSCACLTLINGNGWAMAAVLVVAITACLPVQLPRLQWLFYTYYPAHLGMLWLTRIPLQQAGYILTP